MSRSYTPGLKILAHTKVIINRLLPLKGKVHFKMDDVVKADDIVASSEIPGNVQMMNIANKLNVSEDGIQIKAVDPSHVAMIEANLVKSAFDSYEATTAEMGIDVDKFKTVLAVAGKEDMVDLEKDDKLNRLVVSIGNLTRAMPLLDTSGMPDPKVPSLDLAASVSVSVEEIS